MICCKTKKKKHIHKHVLLIFRNDHHHLLDYEYMLTFENNIFSGRSVWFGWGINDDAGRVTDPRHHWAPLAHWSALNTNWDDYIRPLGVPYTSVSKRRSCWESLNHIRKYTQAYRQDTQTNTHIRTHRWQPFCYTLTPSSVTKISVTLPSTVTQSKMFQASLK